MPSRFVLPALLCILAVPSWAHDAPPSYDRISLNESAQAEVDNDLLVAVLNARAEGREAAAPADEVNRLMDWAVNSARSHPEIKVQTLGYQTQPIYQKSNIRGWRVSQSLRLESRDGRLLGDLIGQLQERLHVQSLGYEVSEEQRRHHVDKLTGEALARFQDRARKVAGAFGRKAFRLVRLTINDGQHQPGPVMRGVMMQAASADGGVAPARIEAGTRQLTVSVNGEIELQRD